MKSTDRLSKYITYGEAIRSESAKRAGIDNTPDKNQLEAMVLVATMIFDEVREFIGAPLYVASFFRSFALNAIVPGASAGSQHMNGEAIDIDCDTYGHGTNKMVFDFIVKNLEFDQIIWEYGTRDNPDWVHVSFVKGPGKRNRKKITRCIRDSKTGQPVYLPYQ